MNLDKNKGKSSSIVNIYLGDIHSVTPLQLNFAMSL